MYGILIVGDPYCDAEEDDASIARADARINAVAATKYHAFLHTAQSIKKVRITLRLWETGPGESLHARTTDDKIATYRTVRIECPEGFIIVDNVSAGPVDFEPGTLERVPLPGGPGIFQLRISMTGREDVNERIVSAWSVEEEGEQARQLRLLDGYERYILDIVRVGPVSDDEDDDVNDQ